MEGNIKIYKYLVIFLWIFSVAGVAYYFSRMNNCPKNFAGLCYNSASAETLKFKPAGENFPDLETMMNSRREFLNVR